MTICYFGDFDPAYSRNRVLIKSLSDAGVTVLVCRSDLAGRSRYAELSKKYRALPQHDLVLVGYTDARDMVPLARVLTRVPIVWDAFYSRYDALVCDRQLVSPWHPKAWIHWLLDFTSAHIAQGILLDTNAHIDYFASAFWVPKRRFIRVLVGTDETLFSSRVAETSSEQLRVGFYGKYIPLQGVDIIVSAARILVDYKRVRFTLLGSGQTYQATRALATKLGARNIEFRTRIPYEELPAFIVASDIMLGIFGTGEKTGRVIPNKVYEALAMGKPIITADTPAIRELLTDEEALLVRAGDPEALARALLALSNDAGRRERMGKAGHEAFRRMATTERIGQTLIADLKHVGLI